MTRPRGYGAAAGKELTEDFVITASGWDGRYARVLLLVADTSVAVALIDSNGDGSALEMEAWHRGPTGWENGASTGGPGTLGSTWNDDALWCVTGTMAPGGTAVIRFEDKDHECQANDLGLWGFVRHVDDIGGDRPEIVTPGESDASNPSPDGRH
jgi:hypothetical protein